MLSTQNNQLKYLALKSNYVGFENDLHFQFDFQATNKRRSKASSNSSESSDKSAKTEKVEKLEVGDSTTNATEEADSEPGKNPSTKIKDTESRVELTLEEEKEETEGKSGFGEGVTQPSAPKLSKTDSASAPNGKRKKKKGIRLTKKPVKKRRGQMGKGKGSGKGKFKSSNRKTEVVNSKLSPEISAAPQQQQRPNSRKVVASIEDILPDLKPTRPVTTPRMMTKRLSSETAKAAQIVRAVTTAEDVFTCLECGQTFEDYVSLNSHKAICNLHKEKRKRVGMVAPGMKYKDDSGPRVAKSATYNEEDYSNFISKAIRQVCVG